MPRVLKRLPERARSRTDRRLQSLRGSTDVRRCASEVEDDILPTASRRIARLRGDFDVTAARRFARRAFSIWIHIDY